MRSSPTPIRRPERETCTNSGAALISTLLVMTFLLLIGALASGQARLSFLVQNRAREAAEALVAAETGLATALADFALEPRFDRLLAGPEGAPYPFVREPPTAPLPDSFDFDLRIETRSERQIDIVADSIGRNRARRRLLATVQRTSRPFVPSALYSSSESPALSGSERLRVSGSEIGGVPALGFPSRATANSAHQHLVSQGAAITGEPAAGAANWSSLGATTELLRSADDSSTLPPDVIGSIPGGVWRSQSSVTVSTAEGTGIWLVDGDLQVHEALDFEGLLFVLGDIIFTDTAEVDITGALIQVEPGRTLQLRGDTNISFDSAALDLVDSLRPELLGRRGILIGWRDHG